MGLPLQSRRRARCRAGPWAFYKLRNDELVPLICPTCQMFSRVKHPRWRPPATLHGVVFDILVGSRHPVGPRVHTRNVSA
jgi:tryptophan-rich sensory protein